MRYLLILVSIMVVFVYGYCIMGKLGRFLDENMKSCKENNCTEHSSIKIAAENSRTISSAAQMMEKCQDINCDIEFFVFNGKIKSLLQKLKEGTVDMVFLDENAVAKENIKFDYITIPHYISSSQTLGTDFKIYVFWNQKIPCIFRDRIIQSFEEQNGGALHFS